MGLKKRHFSFTMTDYYEDYNKSCNKDKKYIVRSRAVYKSFLYDIFAELFHKVLKESWHFVLPYGLGEFYMQETASNRIIRRQKKYYLKEYTNKHTFGKTFKFKWDRTYAKFLSSKYYIFEILHGKSKLNLKYNVGRKAVANFLFSIGKDPEVGMIYPYSKPIRNLEAF